MGAALGEILGFAVGVAISPVPIIAVILMLFTTKAKSNGMSFLVGWLVGLLGAGLIALALGIGASDGGEADSGGWIKIVIGALFIFLGWRQWSSRPRGGDEPQMPKWMATIDNFNAAKSLGLGVVLSAVNPKNLGLTLAAVVVIGSSGMESGEEVITLVIFTLIASLTVAMPVLLYLMLGSNAEEKLTVMKEWLVANNNTVMAVLFVVLGAKVLGDGIAIIA